MAEEARQTFMCAFCSKSFSYQSGLSRHTKKRASNAEGNKK